MISIKKILKADSWMIFVHIFCSGVSSLFILGTKKNRSQQQPADFEKAAEKKIASVREEATFRLLPSYEATKQMKINDVWQKNFTKNFIMTKKIVIIYIISYLILIWYNQTPYFSRCFSNVVSGPKKRMPFLGQATDVKQGILEKQRSIDGMVGSKIRRNLADRLPSSWDLFRSVQQGARSIHMKVRSFICDISWNISRMSL